MPKAVAVIIELVVFICALWVTAFLSTLLHELGHAVGYMLSTGGRRWHIRVGSGKRLFETKRLTVKAPVLDGCFEPAEDRIDSRAKLIATLSGGPAASLVLVILLLLLRFGGVSFDNGVITASSIESLINFALFVNLFILVLSLLPVHYFFGENKGMETDGLKIINAIKGKARKAEEPPSVAAGEETRSSAPETEENMREESKRKIHVAQRGDWKTEPMPEQHETFVLSRAFGAEEMAALRLGNVPQAMEDKWFRYMEGSTLWAHRSWTGNCIYRIDFKEDNNHVVTVNRDPEQYKCTSVEEDLETLNRLLDRWTKLPHDYYNEWLSETYDAVKKAGRE